VPKRIALSLSFTLCLGLGILIANRAVNRRGVMPGANKMNSQFVLADGCKVADLSGVHECYSVRPVKDYYVFTINVSAEHIPAVFLRLAELPPQPVFFTLEVGTHADEEGKLRKSPSDPFHKDVYYLDGLSSADAHRTFEKYERLLTHDGGVSFGIGSHQKNDEVFVGAYKLFSIYTVEPNKYRDAFASLGFQEEPQIRTVWQNFNPSSPGQRSVLKGEPITIWQMIDDLKIHGLRLAERRED
jgi:hypothetical protein